MGYFSNGSEAEYYQREYCHKCLNYRDLGEGRGEGCPVWDLHFLWNYDAVGKDADEDKKTALDFFIPRDKEGSNEQCKMFIA